MERLPDSGVQPAVQATDTASIKHRLRRGRDHLAEWKRRIARTRAELARRFHAGDPIANLLAARTAFVDDLLQETWTAAPWPRAWEERVCLLAVGGYGRGELHPNSDVDLLILTATPADVELTPAIEWFVARLWDIGLDIGHSVSTPAQSATLAATDVTVMTTLLETRRLGGCRALHNQLQLAISTEKIWTGHDFFLAKQEEKTHRRLRYGQIDTNLEPNVKNSPGGLRDLQVIRWIVLRQYGVTEFSALASLGVALQEEVEWLEEAQIFLRRVRFGLHMLCGKAEERLLFDYQRSLAQQFGYQDEHYGQSAVEQFMHQYYWHVMAVLETSDVIFQFFRENMIEDPKTVNSQPIDEHFQITNGAIEVTAPDVFKRHPPALLEIFVQMTRNSDIQGVRVGTIRLMRQSLDNVGYSFRSDPRNTRLFIELLRSRHGLSTALKLMRRYGVLGHYLPEFGRIVGQMQHDLFHIYTVDAHTLRLISNLERFLQPDAQDQFPVAARCAGNIAKVELLYIAGLYHDIAKGRGGDHSKLGAAEVAAFCSRHGLSELDTELVCWLVRDHLLMSTTAQRRDIGDPDVIQEFAGVVRTLERLDHIYLLTVADITATNPKLWNGWRAELLRQLYVETRSALHRGLDNPLSRRQQAVAHRRSGLEQLIDAGQERVEAIWAGLDDSYFMAHPSSELVWQVRNILRHGNSCEPLVVLKDLSAHKVDSNSAATEIFIYTKDRPELFAAIVATLARASVSIQDARLNTGTEFCFDVFIALNAADNQPLPLEQKTRIQRHLIATLRDPGNFPKVAHRRVPRHLRQFCAAPEIRIRPNVDDHYTEVEIRAPSRPDHLVGLSRAFMAEGIQVCNARVATLGETVEDTFSVTDAQGRPLVDESSRQSLTEALRESLRKTDL